MQGDTVDDHGRRGPGDTVSEQSRTDALFFHEAGSWHPLPDWAAFLWRLGQVLGAWTDPTARLVAAVSLPTRAYAGSLLAAGFLCERSIYKSINKSTSLTPGTFVYVQDRRGWYRARVDGTSALPDGSACLKLTIAKGATQLIPANRPLSIRKSREAFEFTQPRQTWDKRTPPTSSLCEEVLKGDVTTFLATPGPDCLLVGSVAASRDELESAVLSTSANGNNRGALREVVRPFGASAVGSSWHTLLLGTHSPEVANLAAEKSPELIILDGTPSIRKWRESFPAAQLVLLLDRSSTDVREASPSVRDLHAGRLEATGPTLPVAPLGIEFTVFQTKRGG